MKLLIVDDHAIFRRLIGDVLASDLSGDLPVLRRAADAACVPNCIGRTSC